MVGDVGRVAGGWCVAVDVDVQMEREKEDDFFLTKHPSFLLKYQLCH